MTFQQLLEQLFRGDIESCLLNDHHVVFLCQKKMSAVLKQEIFCIEAYSFLIPYSVYHATSWKPSI